MLRVRRIGDRHVQAIKATRQFGACSSATNGKAEIAGEEAGPRAWLAAPRSSRWSAMASRVRRLEPLFETRVRPDGLLPIADRHGRDRAERSTAATIDTGSPFGAVVRGGARARARRRWRSCSTSRGRSRGPFPPVWRSRASRRAVTELHRRPSWTQPVKAAAL